jgi:hypothetical protein
MTRYGPNKQKEFTLVQGYWMPSKHQWRLAEVGTTALGWLRAANTSS